MTRFFVSFLFCASLVVSGTVFASKVVKPIHRYQDYVGPSLPAHLKQDNIVEFLAKQSHKDKLVFVNFIHPAGEQTLSRDLSKESANVIAGLIKRLSASMSIHVDQYVIKLPNHGEATETLALYVTLVGDRPDKSQIFSEIDDFLVTSFVYANGKQAYPAYLKQKNLDKKKSEDFNRLYYLTLVDYSFHSIAALYSDSGNYDRSIQFFEPIAKMNNSHAQNSLGKLYLDQKQYDKAIPLFEKASKSGLHYATFNLARIYGEGLGISKNREQEIALYKRAVEQGSRVAAYNLGRIHFRMEQYQQALVWYEKSNAMGFASAHEEVNRTKEIIRLKNEIKDIEALQNKLDDLSRRQKVNKQ